MEFDRIQPVISMSSLPSTASGAGPDLFPTPAGGGGLCLIRSLGRVNCESTWRDMQAFTASRNAHTPDELWVLEHAPVYTVGLAGRSEHFPDPSCHEARHIPLLHIDRGGQITYHGPGQAIVYTLIDLVRRGIKVRDMVCLLEQAAIELLASRGIAAERKKGAPGVYLAQGARRGAKIAALGLKVRRSGCYHGISFNVDADLTPFGAIDPCGYPGLSVTSLAELGLRDNTQEVGMELAQRIADALVKAGESRNLHTCMA